MGPTQPTVPPILGHEPGGCRFYPRHMAGEDAVCGACGAAAPAGAAFCMTCGSPIDLAVPVEVRKTVTSLFCDVVGSTALGESLDPEVSRRAMERWFTSVQVVLSRHGGTVEKFVGDAVLAVFGAPVVHEDDALRACRAALQYRADASGDPAWEGPALPVRIGVETGEVLVAEVTRGSTFASGPAVNLAARLQRAAEPGEVLLGRPVCAWFGSRWWSSLGRGWCSRGSPNRSTGPACGLVDAVPKPVSTTALVGRARELALLRQTFDRVVSDRTCQLATVLGPAGMGKSPLAEEFAAGVAAEALVFRGRCVSYGEGLTYWPLVEVVRQAVGLSGSEAEQDARAALARRWVASRTPTRWWSGSRRWPGSAEHPDLRRTLHGPRDACWRRWPRTDAACWSRTTSTAPSPGWWTS